MMTDAYNPNIEQTETPWGSLAESVSPAFLWEALGFMRNERYRRLTPDLLMGLMQMHTHAPPHGHTHTHRMNTHKHACMHKQTYIHTNTHPYIHTMNAHAMNTHRHTHNEHTHEYIPIHTQ